MGDLVIATPFLRAAGEKYEVTLVCKPVWADLQRRFWPDVRVVPFQAPWTAFKHKYRFYAWPWSRLLHLGKEVGGGRFDAGVSARWDPRDHLLLFAARAKQRIGYPRLGSKIFLTRVLERPGPTAHRYEYWRKLAEAVGVHLPARENLVPAAANGNRGGILIHSGAKQSVRVWPLEHYRSLAAQLRKNNHPVQVVCDPEQRNWWIESGENSVIAPATVTELAAALDRAAVFIGNDSGPGHLAALLGVPTFTLFGPQLPEWFAPLHPQAEWIEGKQCPFKPCSDYCRFNSPHCLLTVTEPEVWERVRTFVTHAAGVNGGRPLNLVA